MIRCQYPEEYINKENFAILSRFLIPKNEVQEQTITGIVSIEEDLVCSVFAFLVFLRIYLWKHHII